jgi:YCII-related domain
MKTFFCKLVPPRTTFAQDMSDAEASLMQAHATYWRGLMDEGLAVGFGLVADPAGAYGIGIVEVDDEAAVQTLTDNDPTIRSGHGFSFQVLPMPRGIVHPPRHDA